MGLIGLRDYNLAFFENYGIPAALIVLEGGWDPDSQNKIAEFINKESKGSANAHRTLVVSSPSGVSAEENKFHYEKLSVDVKEGSFKLYEKSRQENILVAYSMPSQRIGITPTVGKLGGNVAAEQTKLYVQGVVEPLQLDFEEIINNQLLQSEIYDFKFKDIDTRDLIAISEKNNKEIASGARSPNEARNELGLKPYVMGDKFYVGSNLIEAGEADVDTKLSKEDEKKLEKEGDN